MEARGEALGIKFTRGRTRTSYSRFALEAAEFANEYGDPWRFHRRMFQAYFTDLEDVEDLEVILKVGGEAGLDVASLRQAMEERRYRERVEEGMTWTRELGVTAIPTFVFNEQYGIVGAQELPVFREMMAKIGQPPKS